MIEHLLSFTEALVVPYGGWGVFIGSLIEEFIVPIPSAMVQMGGGFFLLSGSPLTLASFGKLFLSVVIPASLGVAVGSLPAYYVSRYVGRPVVDTFGKWIGLNVEDVDAFTKKMEDPKRLLRVLILTRALPIMPSAVVSAVSGILKVNIWVYLMGSVLGTGIRATILGFLGWQLGLAYKTFAVYVGRFEKVGLLIFAGIIVAWIVYKRKQHKREDIASQSSSFL